MARGRKRKAKPAFTVEATAPNKARILKPVRRTGPFANTRILRGAEIPPVCGRIPEGPGYHRWC
jgi:hypothetical protein